MLYFGFFLSFLFEVSLHLYFFLFKDLSLFGQFASISGFLEDVVLLVNHLNLLFHFFAFAFILVHLLLDSFLLIFQLFSSFEYSCEFIMF